jgi:transcriptional regulator
MRLSALERDDGNELRLALWHGIEPVAAEEVFANPGLSPVRDVGIIAFAALGPVRPVGVKIKFRASCSIISSDSAFPLDILEEVYDSPPGNQEERSMGRQQDLLQGTLDMLILRVLSVEPMHGWGISLRVEQMSGNVLLVQQGSLYPAMERLGRKGWVISEVRTTENNRTARYYSLTRTGKKQLESEARNWSRLSVAVNRVMEQA